MKNKVQAESATHFSSVVDLNPIEGSFDLAGRKVKYGSKLSLKVDIILHPTPKGGSDDLKVQKVITSESPVKNSTDNLFKAVVVTTISVIVYFMLTKGGAVIEQIGESMNPAMQRMLNCPGMRSPFMHSIDPNDPRLKA